jgi:hypothetical protein
MQKKPALVINQYGLKLFLYRTNIFIRALETDCNKYLYVIYYSA